ncbi:hypothetical protein FPV67DRAFT_1449690 [Lyophyllum atratum]|nr:hypothetical protein FPV67DRAFT_1449690 [Lyophyllum atratum]
MGDPNREPSLVRAIDSVVKRSITRNSHYSHASTQSWVLSTQQNPPPPPEESDAIVSPVRTLRPLPDPQLQPQHQTQGVRTTTADPSDDEEENMNIDADVPGIDSGHGTERLGLGRSPRPPPASPRFIRDQGQGSGRSFVGGFVNGLRRLPRVVLKYGTFGDKRKFVGPGTIGSGGTTTSALGMRSGNTLPLYASNPPTPLAGPSNTEYIQATDVPVPFPGEEPPSLIRGPSISQRRRHPSFRVTPPSDEMAGQENATDSQQDSRGIPPEFREGVVEPPRTDTVTIYDLPGQEEFPVGDPSLPLSSPTPNRRSGSHHQPSASHATEEALPSPVLARPPPASNYRRMTLSSSPLSPRTFATSLTSDPSFSSEVNPVKRFFLGLYHLPWIAPERVTVDYHPRGHNGGNKKSRGFVKKPMASWYRGTPGVVLSAKAGGADLDLLSSGGRSRGTRSDPSFTPLASPTSARRPRSSDHRRHRPRVHRRRADEAYIPERSRRNRTHHHRNTASTTEMQHQHTASPIIPAVYPYPYSYPYPYQTFPPPAPQHTHSRSTPRGPRPHRHRTQPDTHAYAQYSSSPPHMPSPVYVIHHSPTLSNGSGVAGQGQGQLMYVPMQLVPGGYSPDPNPGGSPPADERVEVGEA